MHKPATNRTSENRASCGVPSRIRTCDLLIKRRMLFVADQGKAAQTGAERKQKAQTKAVHGLERENGLETDRECAEGWACSFAERGTCAELLVLQGRKGWRMGNPGAGPCGLDSRLLGQ